VQARGKPWSRGALALLDYIDRCPDGFRILSRDSSLANPTGSFASILSEIATQVEDILRAEFPRLGHDPQYAHLYAQALVGLVAMTGQQWLDDREPERLVVARHLINLAWNGMAHLTPSPQASRGGQGLTPVGGAASPPGIPVRRLTSQPGGIPPIRPGPPGHCPRHACRPR